MPVLPHPDAPDDSLLFDADDVPLARMRLRDDDGTRVAAGVRPLAGAPLTRLVAQVRRDLAGHRLETPDEALAAALVADGLKLSRAATDMRHDLTDVPAPVALPDRPPTLATGPELLLRQLGSPGAAIGGPGLAERLRRAYREFGSTEGASPTEFGRAEGAR